MEFASIDRAANPGLRFGQLWRGRTYENLSVRMSNLFVAALVTLASSPAQQRTHRSLLGHTLDMTVVKPETVGFSAERLERLHSLMQQAVDQKQVAGVVTILARHGKVVDYRTYGYRDMASGAAMTKDVIFRDYSMTKPVTGVAMMTLYEQGRWLPSDPIAKFIPEFAHLKVFKGVDADGKMILVDPEHAPTMRELMRHTAGFTYGFFGDTPVDKMYRDGNLLASKNLQDFIDKLAKIPLPISPARAGPTACPWISKAISSRSSRAKRCPLSCRIASSSLWA